jgi:phosphatidylinositol-3-phosphatase
MNIKYQLKKLLSLTKNALTGGQWFKSKIFIATVMTLALIPTANMLIIKAAPTSPTVEQAPLQSFQAFTTSRFVAEADAYVNSMNPATNFGTSAQLRADGFPVVVSYLRFNIKGLTGNVKRARLRVFANSYSSVGYYALSVNDNTWDEKTITFFNAPSYARFLGKTGPFNDDVWTIVDITPYITGNGSYTLALIVPGITAVSFASRDAENHAPYLIVTTDNTSTPTPTDAPDDTSTPTPTDIPVNTNTPTPTDIPVNTNTPTPTDIPDDTNTPTPTDIPLNTSTPTPTDIPVNASTPTPTDIPVNTNTPTPTVTPVSTPTNLNISHVFVVVMENHSFNDVWNTNSSPYITSLGNAFARATNYHAITHPSLPNYLDMFGGSNYGITTDCNPSSSCHANVTNLADNLEAKGLTWKGYMESMPSSCYLTTSENYAPKHNPMVYFDDIRNDSARCASHDVPYTALASDLASASTTPNFAFISPNLCNDMHDCSVSTGDTWLKNNLPAILNSPACTVDKCLVALTWDEDDDSQNNQVLTLFAGSGALTGGVSSSHAYTHFSLLRTVEDIFGLPTQTSNDAAASSMTDLLR